MDRGEDDLERRSKKSHRIFFDARTFGKEIGLSAKAAADGFFADGGGNYRVQVAGESFRACCFKVLA